MPENNIYDPLLTMAALNMAVVSLHRITSTQDRVILDREYKNIINNLRMGEIKADPELTDLYKDIVRVIHKGLLRDEVRELMNYDENTAGGMMTPLFMRVTPDMTVKQVMDYIRKEAEEDNIELYYIYVTDKKDHLLGVLSLRALLTTSFQTQIREIMNADIVKLHIDDYRASISDVFILTLIASPYISFNFIAFSTFI